jgi:hypothetical protein
MGDRPISSDNQITDRKWVKYSFAHVKAMIAGQNIVKKRVHWTQRDVVLRSKYHVY